MARLHTIAIGSKYTLWTVKEKLFHKDEDGYQQYICQCSCGTKDILRGTDLHRGRTLGCKPCVARLDLVGLRIGTWKVVHMRAERSADKGNHIQYDCICECGFERTIKGTKFRQGRFPTCPSCKVKESERVSANAVTKAKAESAEFQDRKARAKKIFDSDINIHLKIKLLERFLDLLEKRMSFFMIELNGDSAEFKDFCEQLKTTHDYIESLKKTLSSPGFAVNKLKDQLKGK